MRVLLLLECDREDGERVWYVRLLSSHVPDPEAARPDRARSPSTVTAAARAAPVDGLRDASPRDEELPAYEARGNDPPAPAPVPALAEGDVELQRLAGAPGVPASSAASALDGHGDALPTMPVPSDASPAMPPPAAARPAALDQAYPVVPT